MTDSAPRMGLYSLIMNVKSSHFNLIFIIFYLLYFKGIVDLSKIYDIKKFPTSIINSVSLNRLAKPPSFKASDSRDVSFQLNLDINIIDVSLLFIL